MKTESINQYIYSLENNDCFNIFSNVDGKINLDRIKGRK